MGRILRVLGLLLGIGAVQTVVTDLWAPLGLFDGLMIAAGLLALRLSFVPAILTGAVAGLIQDSLAGGLVGLHAFAKTAVAAALTSLGNVLVVRGELARAIVVGLGAVAEGLLVGLLLRFLGWPEAWPPWLVLGRGLATGILCAAFLLATPRVVMAWKRRRERSGIRIR